MYSGLTNEYLYTAVKIEITFSNGIKGEEKSLSGTGFFVENKDKEIVLVTNRHVLDLPYSNPKYSSMGYQIRNIIAKFRVRDPVTRKPDIIIHGLIQGNIVFANSYDNDVAAIKGISLVNMNPVTKTPNSKTNINYFVDYDLLATKSEFQSDKVSVGDVVAFPGYPEWYDQQNFRPILRSGTVASDTNYSYSSQAFNVAGECFAYEAFSFSGSSGSPVFALQKGIHVGPKSGLKFSGYRRLCLIGINAGHLPVTGSSQHSGTHSGISYMYSSVIVDEVIS